MFLFTFYIATDSNQFYLYLYDGFMLFSLMGNFTYFVIIVYYVKIYDNFN